MVSWQSVVALVNARSIANAIVECKKRAIMIHETSASHLWNNAAATLAAYKHVKSQPVLSLAKGYILAAIDQESHVAEVLHGRESS